MAQISRPALQTLPLEILDEIAFELVALEPLGPPSDILSLLVASSHFNQALSPSANPGLYARIFRHKFDYSAVERRAFTPTSNQYLDQLIHYCRALQILRSGNVFVQPRPMGTDDDDERCAFDALGTGFIMMMEDDGKNARQLQWAGADVFAERFLRRRLYEGRDENDGWPIESPHNSWALWLFWMLTTDEMLLNESHERKESLVYLVLPFASISFRYATSEAPPHFFQLPLTSAHNSLPLTVASAHGPYPVYPSQDRDFTHPYYGSQMLFSPPLAAPAAKLIYFSRREMTILPIPPHFAEDRAELHARGNYEVAQTRDDMYEINWSWTTRLPLDRPAGDSDGCEVWNLPPKPTVARTAGGSVDPASPWFGKAPCLKIKGHKSKRWDTDWFRLRLCGDPLRRNPRIRYGRVYEPGCMDGLWAGRLLITEQERQHALASHTQYPGLELLNDEAPYTMQAPLYLHLNEVHGVHGELAAAMPCGRGEASGLQGGHTAFDHGIGNAWFAGRNGHVRATPVEDNNLRGKCVRIKADGGGEGVYRRWAARARRRGEAGEEEEWTGYRHNSATCEDCQATAILHAKARAHELERERMFQSVGLGSEGAEDDDEDDDDEEGDTASSFSEWDAVAEGDDPNLRAHSRRKVLPCNGIKDIVVFGESSERHGQAWHQFEYYGRVRQWDGLIGIIRKHKGSFGGLVFFYGYLVGGQNFIGNWRVTSVDQSGPVWEHSFCMSRRDDV